jgi:hypothetical protein
MENTMSVAEIHYLHDPPSSGDGFAKSRWRWVRGEEGFQIHKVVLVNFAGNVAGNHNLHGAKIPGFTSKILHLYIYLWLEVGIDLKRRKKRSYWDRSRGLGWPEEEEIGCGTRRVTVARGESRAEERGRFPKNRNSQNGKFPYIESSINSNFNFH